MSADQVARLLRPRGIAIVGVSPEPGSLGGAVLANLERFGYAGDVHLVSRTRREIGGRPCLPSIADLPEGTDVAVLALPGAGILEAVQACAARKVGAALVYAAGFAETGEEGRTAQDAIAAAARAAGMALVGPNCIGLVNFSDGVPLTYEPLKPQPASGAPAVGVVAQSGAMLSTLRGALMAKGLRLSHVVSTGNEVGLGAEDFLAVLVEDPATRAIVMFAEHIRRPQSFLASAAKARANGKPIVLMHPGRSTRARQSAQTHTGALAGDYAVMANVVRAHGVVLVVTAEELIDTAEILARFAPPAAGAAVATNSGAFKGFALDFCETIGLALPQPAADTLAKLKAALPAYAAIDNPLDTTGQTIKQPEIFTDSAAHLLADPGIGSLVVSIVPGGPAQAMAKVEALMPPLAAATKPVAVVAMGDEAPLPPEFSAAFRERNVPVFRSPERALRAMAHATWYGSARVTNDEPAGAATAPDLPGQGGALTEHEGKAIAQALGIAVPRGALARSLDEAQAVARDIGGPVVLKAQARALTHKTEAGGVIVGVQGADALAAAWSTLHENVAKARPELTLDGVLVEAMAEPGLEMVVGARRDPDWGPVVLVGLGGIWVEALHDVRLMPATASRAAIAEEILQLKAARLLHGLRGHPPADMDALVETVAKIAALMRAAPRLTEIDINPLVVHSRGAVALDVLMVVSSAEVS